MDLQYPDIKFHGQCTQRQPRVENVIKSKLKRHIGLYVTLPATTVANTKLIVFPVEFKIIITKHVDRQKHEFHVRYRGL